jgi:hypothetical protein
VRPCPPAHRFGSIRKTTRPSPCHNIPPLVAASGPQRGKTIVFRSIKRKKPYETWPTRLKRPARPGIESELAPGGGPELHSGWPACHVPFESFSMNQANPGRGVHGWPSRVPKDLRWSARSCRSPPVKKNVFSLVPVRSPRRIGAMRNASGCEHRVTPQGPDRGSKPSGKALCALRARRTARQRRGRMKADVGRRRPTDCA